MKDRSNIHKQTTWLTILLLCISAVAALAQVDQASLLSGTWNFEYNKSKDKMDDKAKAHYQKMNEKSRGRFEKAYKDRKITYGEDGSYVQLLADGRKVNGTWKLMENGQTIEVVNQKGTVSQYKIKKLTRKKLVIKPKSTNSANMMLSEWHFTKN